MIDFKSFHKLSYGLYIIATEFEGKKAGYAGNTAFQVTSSPSTIAISSNKENFTTELIQKSGKFSLSVLQKDLDTSIIGDFGFQSTRAIDKFSKHEHKTGQLGIPVVTESCIAAFECEVLNEVDCGTHILFVSEVKHAEQLNDQPPLTYEYYHEHYKMLAPKNAPTYIDPDLLKEEEDSKEEEKDAGGAASEFVCIICGYTYDPEVGEPSMGIPPGTPFEDIPDDFKCPICSASKEYFREA
ncbi:flavin reductase [Roseimarinus sediminis]|uniref:flavin reductase n=1 Tax=Roseimarinus sediminis TaxID=1610899 RepID=UPI003D1C376F